MVSRTAALTVSDPAAPLLVIRGPLFGGDAVRLHRIRRRAAHAARPFGVEVPHADLVVDRVVLAPAVQDAPGLAARPHRRALAGDAEQVLVQVAAERAPDGVVVADALGALGGRVALEA